MAARCGATETCKGEAYLGGLCKSHLDAAWYRSRGQYRITATEAAWPRVRCTKCDGIGKGDGPGNRCVLCNGDGYRVPDGDTLVRAYDPTANALRSANDWAVPRTDAQKRAALYEDFGFGEKTWLEKPPFPMGPLSPAQCSQSTAKPLLGAVRWQVQDNPWQSKRRTISLCPDLAKQPGMTVHAHFFTVRSIVHGESLGDLIADTLLPRWFDDPAEVDKKMAKDDLGGLGWTPTAPLSIWDARAGRQVAVSNFGYRILRGELDILRNARHLCEACGRLRPSAWERPASSIPEFEPWQGLSHIGEICARKTEGARRRRFNWMKATWQFRAEGGALTKDEREELRCWRCFTCHEFKRLRNPWCCEA